MEWKFVEIKDLISEEYHIFAHSPDKDSDKDISLKKKETLEEHTKLCEKYFQKLWNLKGIDKLVSRFISLYFSDLSKEGTSLFYEMFMNIITFHDIGKFNPLYQWEKMQNKLKVENNVLGKLGSTHSAISSVLYIDYFYGKIQELPSEDRKPLWIFLILNGYIISKHHGSLDSFQDFLYGLNQEGEHVEIMNIIDLIKNHYSFLYVHEISLTENRVKNLCRRVEKILTGSATETLSEENYESPIYLYIYTRFFFSLLVACDYYATSEYKSGLEIKEFGEIKNMEEIYHVFENTKVNKKVRQYEKEEYSKSAKVLKNEKDINVLRSELFLDTERALKAYIHENIFFLEAPTGSGKSNVSLNLSFLFAKEKQSIRKIFYVYPFNTLVEQNRKILEKTFEEHEEVLQQIAIINSITPIKGKRRLEIKEKEDESSKEYEEALLNRQFLNYPMILTTHVSLFDFMFGNRRESAFGFYQLMDSVIVLDEIQSYKNTIWTEIITFLKAFGKILNIKIIIMSATLPNLDLLTHNSHQVHHLIHDREKYFSNPLFKDRVVPNYELLHEKVSLTRLFDHVIEKSKNKKILIEFISRKSAYKFYRILTEKKDDFTASIELMTGDDNSIERERILDRISNAQREEGGMILVATQVIEAGVDIDMDIGYKDISKLDSEEQFMGRINRSSLGKRQGEVYFFDLDNAQDIYKNDYRINTEFSLKEEAIREILSSKKFHKYYEPILEEIKKTNKSFNDDNLEDFFAKKVGGLNFTSVAERMTLIEENKWNISVYLCGRLKTMDGTVLDGEEIWNTYKDLLKDDKLNYAKKRVLLSEVTSLMNHFIYEIKANDSFIYDEIIGELFYIKDGDQYFIDGKLDKEKFQTQIGVFI